MGNIARANKPEHVEDVEGSSIGTTVGVRLDLEQGCGIGVDISIGIEVWVAEGADDISVLVGVEVICHVSEIGYSS